MEVIVVYSLGHSGSTFLSLLLATHKRIVNLGEADVAYKEGPVDHIFPEQRNCFCGESAETCPYWSQVFAAKSQLDAREQERSMFQILTDSFAKISENEQIPLFTLKSLGALKALMEVPNIEVKVVHLTRDVRSYSVARVENSVRKQKGLFQRSHTIQCLEWYWRSREIRAFLKTHKLPTVRVGYESMCFNQEGFFKSLEQGLALSPFTRTDNISESKSHALRGNRMRGQRYKWTLRYDHRWLDHTHLMGAWILWPLLSKMNRTLVYGADHREFWERDRPKPENTQ